MTDAQNSELDIAEAKAFVQALTGSPDAVVLLAAIKPATETERLNIHHRRGSISQLWQWVQSRQHELYGVFITVNDTAGARRQKTDITRIRAIFTDNDTVADTWTRDTPLGYSIRPHRRRRSSKTRWTRPRRGSLRFVRPTNNWASPRPKSSTGSQRRTPPRGRW